MKKQYIKPTSTVYEVNLNNHLLEGTSIEITEEKDDEDSRQAREYNHSLNNNIWEEW